MMLQSLLNAKVPTTTCAEFMKPWPDGIAGEPDEAEDKNPNDVEDESNEIIPQDGRDVEL